MTLDEAKALIERMKTVRPTCEKCERRAYAQGTLDKPLADGLLATGWEHESEYAGWMRRCADCRAGRAFPWADKLTPQGIVDFVAKEPWRDERAWNLDDLKPVAEARGGLEFL